MARVLKKNSLTLCGNNICMQNKMHLTHLFPLVEYYRNFTSTFYNFKTPFGIFVLITKFIATSWGGVLILSNCTYDPTFSTDTFNPLDKNLPCPVTRMLHFSRYPSPFRFLPFETLCLVPATLQVQGAPTHFALCTRVGTTMTCFIRIGSSSGLPFDL